MRFNEKGYFFRFFQDSPSDGNVSLLDFFILGFGYRWRMVISFYLIKTPLVKVVTDSLLPSLAAWYPPFGTITVISLVKLLTLDAVKSQFLYVE